VTEPEKPKPSLPIVGVGASAGGLKAFESFLAALPRDFDFALVFVQHLSAKHRSMLPDLLAGRRPDLEVEEIADNERVLPGRLHLCPPGNEVRIQNGSFHVSPRPEGHTHYPIDEFFESMAEAAGERATAVVLSGAGTDGARGIHAVRTAGGCVFVQEPETAEFPGMPLAAIDTGEVDGVYSPEGIVAEILKLRKADEAAASHDAPLTPEEFETFYRLIQERTGHRFVHYKKSVVSRRIRRRMHLCGITSVQDYLALVAGKDSDAKALAYDLMIGVTSFFRDRVAWKALNQDVVRKLAQEDTDVPLRVWTPACATGEESYSVAVTLLETLAQHGKRREVQVFATDVNDTALERAREGKYPASVAADLPQEYLQKYFKTSEDGQSVIVTKGVRERVIFAKQDLLTDPPFSRLDLVICRNLLIYLESDAQDKCLALFHYALKPGGYLFLGNAESAGRNKDIFKALGHKKCRIYRKEEAGPAARLQIAVPFAAERAQAIVANQSLSAEQQQGVIGLVQEALIDKYAPAAVAIDRNYDIVYHNGPTNQYLRHPRGVPTRNLLELLPGPFANRIRSALNRAASEGKPVSIRASVPGEDDKKRQVTLRVTKIGDNLNLVVFGRTTETGPEEDALLSECPAAVEEAAVRQLEAELATTRADLQTHIEQLKSMNEEFQSSNEELQAANEELETSREELQSLNEELITVNSQLQEKIEEQEETNNDLNNFLASTSIPTVFLDRGFRVKRFTPAMSMLIKLLPSDVGRPIIDMSQENLGPELLADARSVLENLAPLKKEIRLDGTWYVRTALPYRTPDSRIEGVVITYNDVTELKRAEERTRHLATFPELNPNPVIEVDASGKVVFANPGTERILESLGVDKKEARVFLPQDLDFILQELDKDVESPVSREVTVKDRVFSATVQLVPQFHVARIYAYDITERKRAEEAQGRLSAIVSSSEDAIISKDLNGIIQTWNVGAEKIFGYTAEEAIGKNISLLVPPGHTDEVPDILRRMSQGEHIENFETVRMRKDGAIIPVSLNFSAIRDSNGKVIGASKIAHDITERKRAEEELKESEENYRRIVDTASEGIWVAEPEGKTVFVNQRMADMLGYSAEEIQGRIGVEFLDEDQKAAVPKTRAELDRGASIERELKFRRKDGTILWTIVSASPLLDGQGRHIGNLSMHTDITERKKSEEELRQSNEELTRFNNAAVGRELRMIEMKKELNELCGRAGLPPRYSVDFDEES
jgi:PAS domain S-box-containing protein